MPLGRLLQPVVSPRFKCPGCWFTWSPGLFLLELLPPSRSGCSSYRCPSCSSHPSPAWFSSKTSASWVSTVVSAPDFERAFAFGSFSLLGIQLGLVAFYRSGWLVQRLGSLPPIFSLFFSLWGLSHSGVNGQGAGGDLPIVLFPLSALGLPCLRSCGGGLGRQCLAGPSVLRDGCLVPVQDSSLPLLRYPLSLRRSGCACLGLRPCGRCL